MANKTTKETATEIRYSKEQFVSSKKYADSKYALMALLEDGKAYTEAEVNTLLDNFMKGKVK